MEKSNKKWTKDRNKNLNYLLKKQLEFYFSDANLQKDRFLKKEIISSEDGFVDVEMFTRFNKIKSLTENLDHIITAIQSSSLIMMHDDGKRVGRVKPFVEPKDVDERTVYVELLPAHATVEWLERVFKECGKVVYVSLPKFKSTRDLKGFAFVEFKEQAQAEIACKKMNRPPQTLIHTKPGVFPKGSKSEKELEKKLQKTAASNYMDVTQVDEDKKEIKNGDDVDKDDGGNKEDVDGDDKDDDGDNDGKDEDGDNEEGGYDDDVGNKNDGKKKRMILSDVAENTKKRKLNDEEEEDEKSKKKLKLKRDGDGGDDEDEGEKKSNDKVCKVNKKKNEVVEGDKVKNKGEKKKKKMKSEIKLNNSNNSKLSKTPKTQLRVISKAEWLRLKQEYLQTQKRKMALLKKQIKEVKEVVGVVNHNNHRYGNQTNHHHSHNDQDESNPDKRGGEAETIYPDGHQNVKSNNDTYSGKLHEGNGKENGIHGNDNDRDGKKDDDGKKDGDDGKKNGDDGKNEKKDDSSTHTLSIVPNSIIKLNLDEPVSKKFLKELLEARGAKVAFIEITDGETEGHVRVHDSKDSEVILAAGLAGIKCSLLQGDEEKAYWDKIFADRQLRLSTKHKKKQRGKDKVVRRADDCLTALKKHHQHILFE